MDIDFESTDEVDEATYLRMVSGKTAALASFACEAGGLVAGASVAQVRGLHDFGYNVGMSFQMQDDLLGLWGDPARTGKPGGRRPATAQKNLAHSARIGSLSGTPIAARTSRA